MNRSSTSSFRANRRSRQIETRYQRCPLCNSRDIHLGTETIRASTRTGSKSSVKVRRWKCENCGESFLTAESRKQLDRSLKRSAA